MGFDQFCAEIEEINGCPLNVEQVRVAAQMTHTDRRNVLWLLKNPELVDNAFEAIRRLVDEAKRLGLVEPEDELRGSE